MSDQGKIKVLVVDDHPVVRAGLGAIVGYQEDMELVGLAEDGIRAIALFEEGIPDVTLVDLSLPDMNGVELITRLRARFPSGRFLVLTANAGGSEIGKALNAGAQSYLFKNAPSEELLAAIRTVFKGGQYLSPAARLKAREASALVELTARELEVLQWIARGHSNRQIAAEMHVTDETVKFHVSNLLAKLGVGSRSKAVAIAQQIGLI